LDPDKELDPEGALDPEEKLDPEERFDPEDALETFDGEEALDPDKGSPAFSSPISVTIPSPIRTYPFCRVSRGVTTFAFLISKEFIVVVIKMPGRPP
jgi:hypothetical protein